MQSDDTVQIPLYARDGSIRAYTTVDAADAGWLNQWRWHLDSDGYATRTERDGERWYQVSMSRQLLGLREGDPAQSDHIHRNKLDNRRSQLRAVASVLNGQNRAAQHGSVSGLRGVCWSKLKGKWVAYVYIKDLSFQSKQKRIHLGYFDNPTSAANAAKAGRLRLLPGAID